MAGPTDALNVITPVVLTALGLVLPEIAKREQKNKFTCLTRYGKITNNRCCLLYTSDAADD